MKPQFDILAAMRAGTEYRSQVSIRQGIFSLRPLSNVETVQVADTIQEKLLGLPVHRRHSLTEHTLVARETLKIASTPDVDDYQPSITDPILDRMTNDELQNLYQEYVRICDKVNPKLEFVEESRVRELIEDLKKNKDSQALGLQVIELSISEMVSVCRQLILDASQTDNSSGGSSIQS